MNTSIRTSLLSFVIVALLAVAATLVCTHGAAPGEVELLSTLPAALPV